MNQKLPVRPQLSHLKKQAKELLAEAQSGGALALQRISENHPRSVVRELASLSDAQLVLAREYGFASWPKLKAHVEAQMGISRVEMPQMPKALKRALEDLRAGRFCILFDDEGRENEGDLIIPAEKVTGEAINFLTKHGRGTICLAMNNEGAKRLGLRLINPERKDMGEPAFLTSIDATEGVTTGVSAFDRAETVRRAIAEEAGAHSVRSPGHVFPLLAHPGGISARQGHTEGSLELMRLAGLKPAAVICEILNDDGSMARLPELMEVGERHGIALVKMSEMLEYRAAVLN